MRTTRATQRVAEEDLNSAEQTLSVVAEKDPAPAVIPAVEREESAVSAKETKQKKGGKKNKKTKKAAAKNEEDDENNTNKGAINENEPTKPSARDNGNKTSNGNVDVDEESRAVVGEDPFVERPASPAVKHQFIPQLPVDNAREMEEPEVGAKDVIAAEPKKPEAMVDSLGIKTDVGDKQDMPVTSHVTSESIEEKPDLASPTSHLTSPTIVGPHSEDPIEAIDALEDALEEVGKILPKIEPVSPVKPQMTTAAKKKVGAPPSQKSKPTTTKKPAPVTAKKPTASKPSSGSSLLKTTQPSATSRSTPRSAHTAGGSKPPPTQSSKPPPAVVTKQTPTVAKPLEPTAKATAHKKRQSVILPPKDTKDRPDYLTQKRRPISMQFPPPPGPIRSAKPPTRPTFVLPSDALEEKRKAARAEREERRKKEEEELQRRREFKARPIPSKVIAGAGVRQTASSLKRRSVVFGNADVPAAETVNQNGGKEISQPTSTANKRMSVAHGRAKSVTNPSTKRSSMILSASVGPNMANKRSSLIINPKRQSVVGAVSGANPDTSTRDSSPATGAKPNVSQGDVAGQKVKAREIYNRDKISKDNREKERREKEEAAKRARAAAAEKGRQASREWAEKQKKRALAEAAKKAAAGTAEIQA